MPSETAPSPQVYLARHPIKIPIIIDIPEDFPTIIYETHKITHSVCNRLPANRSSQCRRDPQLSPGPSYLRPCLWYVLRRRGFIVPLPHQHSRHLLRGGNRLVQGKQKQVSHKEIAHLGQWRHQVHPSPQQRHRGDSRPEGEQERQTAAEVQVQSRRLQLQHPKEG